MTHLFYFRLLASFSVNFSWKFDLLMLCGDIKSNPGPSPNSSQSFSICYWNLNSIAVHNFPKISLLKAYNAIHTTDTIYLLETHLNHGTLFDDDNLRIQGYKLIRVDHPSNQKWGSVCIYHKDFLQVKVSNVSCLMEGIFKFQSQCKWEILGQGQKIDVLVIKELMKVINLNPWLPNADLNMYVVIQLIF